MLALAALPGWVYGVALVGILGAGAYFYFDYTQNKMAELNDTIGALNSELASAEATIEGLKSAARFNQKAYTKLETRATVAEQEVSSIQKVFQNHDLTRLATEKPGLIEGIINDGTREALDDLESLTTITE